MSKVNTGSPKAVKLGSVPDFGIEGSRTKKPSVTPPPEPANGTAGNLKQPLIMRVGSDASKQSDQTTNVFRNNLAVAPKNEKVVQAPTFALETPRRDTDTFVNFQFSSTAELGGQTCMSK